ncbi:DUF1292 domain-containing protein [Paenibacillus endoradicis]|uniref:DUF1292 domain-containing protein n=1 Tax=Paenibacillus endoradicis TaxID=2972487 RepID=UPI002158D07A|nr:DUF1292 domain-containing protein [Paenibacillus endoradicis]MCR8655772.1 DUF1292 domain-containing protein [Paenibacillus endoradicis]MCR8658098.1 DUF1292 domain-containing protein [Paenibacillus endoradicis]
MAFQQPNTAPIIQDTLKEHFGQEIELVTDDGSVEAFFITQEFVWGDITYVVLQTETMKAEDEVEFLRVYKQNDEVELESIVDEEEWEAISEAYDDLQFVSDERP